MMTPSPCLLVSCLAHASFADNISPFDVLIRHLQMARVTQLFQFNTETNQTALKGDLLTYKLHAGQIDYDGLLNVTGVIRNSGVGRNQERLTMAALSSSVVGCTVEPAGSGRVTPRQTEFCPVRWPGCCWAAFTVPTETN